MKHLGRQIVKPSKSGIVKSPNLNKTQPFSRGHVTGM
jgi:hypothetical protein